MMVWIQVISILFFLLWCALFIFKNRKDYVALIALGFKIIAGLCLGLLYKFYLGGGDTFQYFWEGKTILSYLFDHPTDWFSIYFKTIHVKELAHQIVYYDQPRALLFSKIISVFYFLSGGSYWITSAYLSLINFICIHKLVQELNRSFPEYKRAFSMSFYFLPTFVFWTSGLLKESLALGALAVLVTTIINFNRTKKYKKVSEWLFFAGSTMILWELKYYYAAVVIPILVTLLVYFSINKRKYFHPAMILVIWLGGIVLISVLHYNLSLSRVMEVVYQNYQKSNTESVGIHYYHFDGSWYGFLINFPLALFSGLFRPMFFDVTNILGVLVSIENLAVLAIMIFGIWKSNFKISVKNPYILATLLYVVSLAVLLAFSSPNLGSLSRYKVGYWPFFVSMILLIIYNGNKKGQILHEPDLKNHH